MIFTPLVSLQLKLFFAPFSFSSSFKLWLLFISLSRCSTSGIDLLLFELQVAYFHEYCCNLSTILLFSLLFFLRKESKILRNDALFEDLSSLDKVLLASKFPIDSIGMEFKEPCVDIDVLWLLCSFRLRDAILDIISYSCDCSNNSNMV